MLAGQIHAEFRGRTRRCGRRVGSVAGIAAGDRARVVSGAAVTVGTKYFGLLKARSAATRLAEKDRIIERLDGDISKLTAGGNELSTRLDNVRDECRQVREQVFILHSKSEEQWKVRGARRT